MTGLSAYRLSFIPGLTIPYQRSTKHLTNNKNEAALELVCLALQRLCFMRALLSLALALRIDGRSHFKVVVIGVMFMRSAALGFREHDSDDDDFEVRAAIDPQR